MPTGKENTRIRSGSFCPGYSSKRRGRRAEASAARILLGLLLAPAVCLGQAVLPRPRDWSENVVSADRERFLAELRKRRIIAKDAEQWTPAEYTRLLRLREAERLGAFELIRSKLGTLRGFATEHDARGYKSLWLTAEGYDRFVFLLSQDARAYFETRGAAAKFVYELRTVEGKRLFSDKGLLTQEGIEVYARIRRKLPVFWKHADGRINGNVRPPDSLLRSGERPTEPIGEEVPPPHAVGTRPAEPGKPEQEDQAALSRMAALINSGYVELSEAEVRGLVEKSSIPLERLARESSLQIIAAKKRTFYLLSPSDPLMSDVSGMRGGQTAPPAIPESGPQGGAPPPEEK